MNLLIDKLKEKSGMVVILLVGLIGVTLFFIGGERDAEVEVSENAERNMEKYIEYLEGRIESMIAKMEGVSSVTVMLQPDGGEENVYARNGNEGGAQYVIMSGKKGDEALLVKQVEPKIRGAAVICKGGDDPNLQVKIVKLLCALFQLQSNRVYVSG